MSACCPYCITLWACDIKRKRCPRHGSHTMMHESNPVETIYIEQIKQFFFFFFLQFYHRFLDKTHHLEELIVENTTNAFGVRVAIWGFLVNYMLANEDSYHHAGNNHCTSQRVKHYSHRSIFTQLTWQFVVCLFTKYIRNFLFNLLIYFIY